MGLEINKDDLVIREADKSKLLYAISIADSIIKSKDSHKICGDLDRIWRICGYASKEKFDKLFKQYKGMTLSEYCKKLNPNCGC
jgi:AraC-like DNA-binding protein